MSNSIFQLVTPDKPKVLAQERIFVYMPTANETQKGRASFFTEDFSAPLGEVKLRWPTKMMVEQLANPLLRPSLTKVSSDEFKNTAEPSTLTNPVTGVSYISNTSEIKLNRDSRNAFTRPELVMLNSGDFEAEVEGSYNKYRIKRADPMTVPALIQVDINDFTREDGIVKLNWPMAHDPESGSSRTNGFGLVKIDLVNGALIFNESNELQVDKSLLTDEISDVIIPLITKDTVGLGQLENINFKDRVYSEFSDAMKATFDLKFGAKVDTTDWSTNNGLVQGVLEDLKDEDQSIRETINSLRLFLGMYATSAALETAYPAAEDLQGSFAFVKATDTYWAIQFNFDVWEWYDTLIEDSHLLGLMGLETDAGELMADSDTPSVGSSGKWVNSDHVHPSDPGKANAGFEIEISSAAPGEGDFIIKLNQPAVNIPYVRTAQFIHNWRNNTGEFTQDADSNAAYWSGSAADFDKLPSENLPLGSLIVVDDDEVYEAGDLVLTDVMDKIGITIPDRAFVGDFTEQLVIVMKDDSFDGRPLTMESGALVEGGEPRRVIKPIDFEVVSTPQFLAGVDSENKLVKTEFTRNRLLKTNSSSRVIDSDLNPGNMIASTGAGDTVVQLTPGRIVISDSANKVTTFDTGIDANRLLVSDGANGVKVLDLAVSRILTTVGSGGVTTVLWVEANLVKTSTGELAELMDGGKVVISGEDNTVEHWTSGGEEESLIVRGLTDGTIKVKTWVGENGLVLTGPDGTLIELGNGQPGQIVGNDGENGVGWIDAPAEYSHMPQTVLTSNPTVEDAVNFKGLVAVVLDDEPVDGYRNNCVYYIG